MKNCFHFVGMSAYGRRVGCRNAAIRSLSEEKRILHGDRKSARPGSKESRRKAGKARIAYGAKAPLYAADRIVHPKAGLELRFAPRNKLPGLMPIKS
jgi:hypothetical protein